MWNVDILNHVRESIAVGAFTDFHDVKDFCKRHNYAPEIHITKVPADNLNLFQVR